jgi:hypothetical protein
MMKYRNYFYVFVAAIISLQCNPAKKTSGDHLTGLIFASKDELAGIPLASSPYGAGDLPSFKDLSADLPPVGNQGKQSSCVGWAAAYALKSFQEKIETKATLLFSPSFIYNQINNGQDGGARFIDALNLLSQLGAAKYEDMPYNEFDFRTQPSQEVKERAKPFRIDYWRQVNVMDIKEVKAQVNAGYPVVIGTAVDQGFQNAKRTGFTEYVWKASQGNGLGGHAMLVVGFDDSKNAFKVMNSWGTGWGNDGFCWLDYSYFTRAVKEGYVAKDAVTPTTTTTTTTTTDPNTNVVIPNYNPTEFRNARIDNIQVVHNHNDPTYGNGMKITGIVDIPKGTGKTFQFSMHFYYDGTTTQVGSLQSPKFADVNGYAATGTILYSIPDDGLNNWNFEVFMPYTAFNIQAGSTVNGVYQRYRTNMYAIPTLFIDNFGYAKGDQITFYVDK